MVFVLVLPLYAEELQPPRQFDAQCVNCHSLSGAGIKGGSAGGDLTLIMQRAVEHGGLDGYLQYRYGVGVELFLLYPSRYVPDMALVEGKLFTRDIDRMVAYLESIPTEPKQSSKPLYWYVPLLLSVTLAYFAMRHLKKGAISTLFYWI